VEVGDASGWASTAVAVIAAVVAVAAWWAAHRSAKASERSADANEQLLHQQRTPQFTARIEEVNDGSWHRLAIRLDGPVSLDDLSVEVLDDELIFSSDQYGIDKTRLARQEQPGRRLAWAYDQNGSRAAVEIGETTKWRVAAAEDHVRSDEITVRARARAGRSEWVVLVKIPVPGSLHPAGFVL
jgi:hypothetical protein